MSKKIILLLKDGLSCLESIPDNSVNLVLTDPPYITSRETGMDKWVDHINKQDTEDSENVKTEEDWLSYKTADQWSAWMHNGGVPEEKREKIGSYLEKRKKAQKIKR